MRSIPLLGVVFLLVGCDVTRTLGDDLRVDPVAPLAGAGSGSAHSAGAGRPTLRWRSSTAAQIYHLQVDDSCAAAATCDFPSPEIDEVALTAASYVPASPLVPDSTPPFVRRYYWRVQACGADSCGEWSPTRYFVVGQDLALNRDLNGDGFADFIVGAPRAGDAAEPGGQASVFLGGPTLPSRAALVLSSDMPWEYLGSAVAMAGDANGDGYGDYLVRSWPTPASDGTLQPGRVQLFFGGPGLRSQPDIVFAANAWGALNDFTNGSTVGCGDLNGDGYDDIAFAAGDLPADTTPIISTWVEIHFGGPDMASSAPLVLHGDSPSASTIPPTAYRYDLFGSSISAAGDVNGDGYPDLIVGDCDSDDVSIHGGRVRIYFGGPQMHATPDVVLEMAKASAPGLDGQLFGFSVAGLGDVNGDGFADVAVGAPALDVNSPGTIISRVYVYFGGTEPPHTSPDLVIEGEQGSEEFGALVVAAGDVDHDGYADFAVLAPGFHATPHLQDILADRLGKVSLYSGGPNVGQSLLASVTGGTAFPIIRSVAVLDIDGDADPEMLVSQLDNTMDALYNQVSVYRSADGYAVPARTIPGSGSRTDFVGVVLSP